MEKIDLIYGIVRENREDVKKILAFMPKVQTQKQCEAIRKSNKDTKTGWLKYIITTTIAIIALIVSFGAMFFYP